MPKRISAEKRATCIRLRVTERLSTPTIARKVGISNFAAYRILRAHPWSGERYCRTDWTAAELATLRRMFPTAEEAEIVAALPGRAWPAISKKASALAIKRPQPGTRLNKRAVPTLCADLRRARESQKLRRSDVGDSAGYHVNQILAWELGKARPDVRSLVDWAGALGFDVVLRPKAAALVTEAPRSRLMAGR